MEIRTNFFSSSQDRVAHEIPAKKRQRDSRYMMKQKPIKKALLVVFETRIYHWP